ncbi:methyltransferase domain-containing protein [Nonomuraea sp. NPDC049750]|uniref:methyltransferase domain-containing protein n=1 Tax=Nonomuraea sp. NPDC049750 TaxID=3154738 RepID=UPI0033C2262C
MTTVAYLDQLAASAPGRAYKRDLLTMMDLRPGQTVLDIGCGPGTDLADLSDGVTSSGTVIGLDHDPAIADQARLRLADRTNVEIRVGDAHAMPLDDGAVDRARTDGDGVQPGDPGPGDGRAALRPAPHPLQGCAGGLPGRLRRPRLRALPGQLPAVHGGGRRTLTASTRTGGRAVQKQVVRPAALYLAFALR